MKVRWCHHYYCHQHYYYHHTCPPHPHQYFCIISVTAQSYTLKSNLLKKQRIVVYILCFPELSSMLLYSRDCINFIALWLPVGFGQWKGQQETGEQEKEVRVIISSVIFSVSFSWVTLVWLGVCNKEYNTVCTCTSSRLLSGGPLLQIQIFPTWVTIPTSCLFRPRLVMASLSLPVPACFTISCRVPWIVPILL